MNSGKRYEKEKVVYDLGSLELKTPSLLKIGMRKAHCERAYVNFEKGFYPEVH